MNNLSEDELSSLAIQIFLKNSLPLIENEFLAMNPFLTNKSESKLKNKPIFNKKNQEILIYFFNSFIFK